MPAWLRTHWKTFTVAMFDRGGMKYVFDHARNLVVATLVLAAGLEARIGTRQVPHAWDTLIIGNFVAAFGLALLLLNLLDGLHRLSRLRFHLVLQVLLAAVYVIFSWRVTQLVVMFRTPDF